MTKRKSDAEKKQPKMKAGDKYGEWELVKYFPSVYEGTKRLSKPRWLCRCSCGTEKLYATDTLNENGARLSCHGPNRKAGAGPTRHDRKHSPQVEIRARVSSVFDLARIV